jgi:hypothetical protein
MTEQTLEARAALERLFNQDDVTVSYDGNALGDYEIRFEDACFSDRKKEALRRLGFKPGSTHAHTTTDGEPYMTVYVNDQR